MGTARPRSAWRARTERDRGRVVWPGEGVRGRQRQRRLETNRLPQGQGQVEEKCCYWIQMIYEGGHLRFYKVRMGLRRVFRKSVQ